MSELRTTTWTSPLTADATYSGGVGCLPIGTAPRSSFKVSGQQHPTFTSSRTLPAITALGQSTAPTGSPGVVTCSAKLLYHLDGTVSNRSRLRHVGQALGAHPNPLPLRQPGRPGRGPIRHVSLQKCHVVTPITFLPDCYVFMRG